MADMRYFLLMIEVVPGVAVAVAQEPRPAREVKQLHIQRGHESMGSFSLEETTQHLSEGRLLETDLAWHEGLEENGSPPANWITSCWSRGNTGGRGSYP